MKTGAVIEAGKVTNVIVLPADAKERAEIAALVGAVEIPDGTAAGIGWDYDGKEFVDNRPTPEPGPAPEPSVSDDVAALARLLDVDPEAVKTEMSRTDTESR